MFPRCVHFGSRPRQTEEVYVKCSSAGLTIWGILVNNGKGRHTSEVIFGDQPKKESHYVLCQMRHLRFELGLSLCLINQKEILFFPQGPHSLAQAQGFRSSRPCFLIPEMRILPDQETTALITRKIRGRGLCEFSQTFLLSAFKIYFVVFIFY